MRPKQEARKAVIRDFIQEYYETYDRQPSEKNISDGTGIAAASVHSYLVEMREAGEVLYDGGRRSVKTIEMDSASRKKVIPVLGYVACGPGQEEEDQFIEYIHISESLTGKGDFFALIAKGESMVDAGVHPDDYVIVRKQQTADDGDLVIALLDNKNNLKGFVREDGKIILRSYNSGHPEQYPDIIPEEEEELRIQGVAVGVYHSLMDTAR